MVADARTNWAVGEDCAAAINAGAANGNVRIPKDIASSKGDIAVFNGTAWTKVARAGVSGNVLTEDTTTATGWKSAASAGGGGGGGSLATQRQSIMGLGDSLDAFVAPYDATLGGDSHQGAVGGHNPKDYLFLGNLLANSVLDVLGSAATSGYSVEQIRDNHLPTILAVKPTYCLCWSLGANNLLLAGEFSPTVLDVTEYILNAMVSAGVTPILCTLPPAINSTTSGLVSQSEITRYNAWICNYAQKNGFPILDFYQALIDWTTGDYMAGYSDDHVHPNELGVSKIVPLIRDLILKLSNTWTRNSLACVNTAVAGQMANPLLVDGGSGLPTGWSVGATVSKSIAAAASYPGNELTLAAGASLGYLNTPTLNCAAGEEWDLGLRLSTTPVGSGGWGMAISNQSGTNICTIGSTTAPNPTAVPANTVLHLRGTVPTGTTSLHPFVWVLGSGSVMKLGQFTLRNLSAGGLNVF
jgi:lysophospholipase L1-like esterase